MSNVSYGGPNETAYVTYVFQVSKPFLPGELTEKLADLNLGIEIAHVL